MQFVEYHFYIQPIAPWTEILIAHLAQSSFDTFEETDSGLKAYILADEDEPEFVNEVLERLDEAHITFERKVMDKVNWNEEWETHFKPVEVNGKCYIRAEFHQPEPGYDYEIVIQPKMSFGTGHHETTHLMVEQMLEMDFEGKKVLDMGAGTGILAILAAMRGATPVVGIDIDEWSYQNAVENAERNGVDIHFIQGGAESIPQEEYDVVLANINKNILQEDMLFYSNVLPAGASLLLSGIYDFDFEDIQETAKKHGLEFEEKRNRNQWISVLFKKK
ncbi:MAG: 50S ribosomal protein L11 methyltransferase [Weeksellaceae bacterium]|nr:50S ribosomal protein L11 methyltransferase [Weeksellaceae bacterium]